MAKKRARRLVPGTSQEWQEAVNLAEFLLLVHSARQYGLITGGPEVNVDRCVDMLARGARHGYRPVRSAVDAAIAAAASERGSEKSLPNGR